jgi:hypothetical protein
MSRSRACFARAAFSVPAALIHCRAGGAARPAASEAICCPVFHPEPWDEREVQWQEKPFVQDKVRCLFHVPLNFGGVMRRNMQRIEAAGAKGAEVIVLSDPCSPWSADVFIDVTKDVPGARMTRLSGTFLAKVFEGPYREFGTWMKQMQAWVASKGKQPKKILAYYTTCPRCAKKHGKNYVVLLART